MEDKRTTHEQRKDKQTISTKKTKNNNKCEYENNKHNT